MCPWNKQYYFAKLRFPRLSNMLSSINMIEGVMSVRD
uniref:Uncharacterized protein n=1 Tax=Lepeophtheirus salmonis TaxID=72036 RepID=A0A0K2TEG9_LEPSM